MGASGTSTFDARAAIPFGRLMLGGPRALAFDRFLVAKTGWSLISLQAAVVRQAPYAPTLLLTTIGARTGRLRDVALPYLQVQNDLVVVGSNAGGPRDPLWAANLRHHPQCWVTVRRTRGPAVAEVVTGSAREALLHEIARKRPIVLDYEIRARSFGRQMPIVRLTEGAYAAARDCPAGRNDVGYLIDRARISDLLITYFRGIDHGQDREVLATCFTEDATADYDGLVVHGREAVLDYLTGQGGSTVTLGRIEVMFHQIGNVTFNLDGDEADTETYALAHLVDEVDGKSRLRVRGIRYLDHLIRDGDQWQIRNRALRAAWTAEGQLVSATGGAIPNG